MGRLQPVRRASDVGLPGQRPALDVLALALFRAFYRAVFRRWPPAAGDGVARSVVQALNMARVESGIYITVAKLINQPGKPWAVLVDVEPDELHDGSTLVEDTREEEHGRGSVYTLFAFASRSPFPLAGFFADVNTPWPAHANAVGPWFDALLDRLQALAPGEAEVRLARRELNEEAVWAAVLDAAATRYALDAPVGSAVQAAPSAPSAPLASHGVDAANEGEESAASVNGLVSAAPARPRSLTQAIGVAPDALAALFAAFRAEEQDLSRQVESLLDDELVVLHHSVDDRFRALYPKLSPTARRDVTERWAAELQLRDTPVVDATGHDVLGLRAASLRLLDLRARQQQCRRMLEHVCTQFPGGHDLTDRTTGRLRCARCQMEASGIGAVAPPALALAAPPALLTVSPTMPGLPAPPGSSTGLATGHNALSGSGGGRADRGSTGSSGGGDRSSGGGATIPDGEEFLR